ncbi:MULTISPECIES: hypothetical protein [unclassified Pseudoclavibacter]|uniref:hypothetical protein n=1 Tax=unclassified Pseudoclavibacter TaxID=2615177 RepID=UPI001BA920EA|nr:hypothetical protein [Pseudoclavibacter sp. Marseille-Q4354]MBS3177772.1 hypothetical protein [Pseudoclavibacter sp. Marseille-Q4354]
MPRTRAWLRWLWSEFTYPPHMRAIYVWVYILTICGGVVTWTSPPRTIASEIGPILSNVWALALLCGGILGLIFVATPWWAMERAAVLLSMSGLGVYAYVVLILHLGSEPGSSRLLQLVVIVLAATLYFIRLVSVRHYSFQPLSRRTMPHAG